MRWDDWEMSDHGFMLFPRDVLNPKLVDEHFRPEASAARGEGISIALLDHDALLAGDTAHAIRGIGDDADALVYRGWMIPPDRYRELETALGNGRLRTTADEFRRAHHLPHWYPSLAEHTPVSVWTTTPDLDEFVATLAELPGGPAVIKDYSKSEKHYWDEAMFIPDVRDAAAAKAVASRFQELRGDFFDTGFVVRVFEPFVGDEVRSWWVNGELRCVTAHPDAPDASPPELDLSSLHDAVPLLDLRFVAVDLVRDEVGRTRIVEVGDGQVSDRPTSCDPTDFIRATSSRFLA